MAEKQKEKKPIFNFDDKEYIIEDMSDEQRVMAAKVLKFQDHVRDIQKKLQTNMFLKEQFVENEKTFLKKLEKGKAKLRKLMKVEVETNIAEAAA
jgi:predicted GTPase